TAAARVLPAPLRRTQQFAGRATVGIGARIVTEILAAEAALLLELAVALVQRHIGNDAVILAGLQVLAVVIGGIGRRLQGLYVENRFRFLRHRMQLPRVISAAHGPCNTDQSFLV